MAYFYYRALGNTQLAAIGLLSFAAIAQTKSPGLGSGPFGVQKPRGYRGLLA